MDDFKVRAHLLVFFGIAANMTNMNKKNISLLDKYSHSFLFLFFFKNKIHNTSL